MPVQRTTIAQSCSIQTMCRFIAVLMCLSSVACAAGAVEKDLVNYINQDIMGVVEVEQAALARYSAVSGENYVSDQVLYNTLKREVIPTFSEFVDVLQRIEPETDVVKQLHAKYVNGATYRLRGFQTIMGGIYSQDAQVIRAANGLLNEGALETEQWRMELHQLYEMYGIRQMEP
jgi:hypothetical protein